MEKDWPQITRIWMPATRGSVALGYRDSEGHNSEGGGSPCPCTLGTARVLASQAAAPPSHSPLTGAELPQAKRFLNLGA